jgi:predicted nucleic acid-binding protein
MIYGNDCWIAALAPQHKLGLLSKDQNRKIITLEQIGMRSHSLKNNSVLFQLVN